MSTLSLKRVPLFMCEEVFSIGTLFTNQEDGVFIKLKLQAKS